MNRYEPEFTSIHLVISVLIPQYQIYSNSLR